MAESISSGKVITSISRGGVGLVDRVGDGVGDGKGCAWNDI